MVEPEIRSLAGIHLTDLANAEDINRALDAGFTREKDKDDVKRTHMFNGRFENIYISHERLPELQAVSDFALTTARRILNRVSLHMGCWFNEMPPGHSTTLHTHEENDELLSAVYYIKTSPDGGDLVLHDDEARITIEPRPGLLILFPPDLPHEVGRNDSDKTRLSVAFNFGPTNSAP